MSSRVRTVLIVILVCLAILLFAGWATGFFNFSAKKDASVAGVVTYLEQAALPDGARVVVQLRDMTAAGAPTLILDEQVIENAGQVPIPFEVRYNSKEIDERHTYIVYAQISDGEDNLLYTSAQPALVITQGKPTAEVEVIVQPVR